MIWICISNNAGLPLISFDIADIRAIAKEAYNVVLLEGYANGSCRISDSIEDAIIKICTVAKGFDLFSANKIFVHLSYNKKEPIHTSVMWGLSYDNNIADETVIARLIASNLKLKNIKYLNYGNKEIDK